jgi:hypothetical protein
MKVLGIDLAGSKKRPTGICLMDGRLKINCKTLFKDEEILDLIEKEKPNLIAIDAPLSLPSGRKDLRKPPTKRSGGGHFRECDRELFSLGIKFFPITLGPMRLLTKRGIKLKKALEKEGLEVIEVYPGASQDLLSIPRKGKGLKSLSSGLKKLGIEGLKKNLTADELDAVTAAHTGLLYLNGKFLAIGNKKEGLIILPKNEKISFLSKPSKRRIRGKN